jgi:hypothetical protein
MSWLWGKPNDLILVLLAANGAIALRSAPQNCGSVCNVSGSFLLPYPRTSQGWNHGSSKNYLFNGMGPIVRPGMM